MDQYYGGPYGPQSQPQQVMMPAGAMEQMTELWKERERIRKEREPLQKILREQVERLHGLKVGTTAEAIEVAKAISEIVRSVPLF